MTSQTESQRLRDAADAAREAALEAACAAADVAWAAAYAAAWEAERKAGDAGDDALRVRVKELEVELAKLQDKINPPRAHYERP